MCNPRKKEESSHPRWGSLEVTVHFQQQTHPQTTPTMQAGGGELQQCLHTTLSTGATCGFTILAAFSFFPRATALLSRVGSSFILWKQAALKMPCVCVCARACVCTCACTFQLHPTLCDPTLWTIARLAPLSMGILQARILRWVLRPSSRESS